MNWPRLLARHDIFENLLLGNPTSITIIASSIKDPMLSATLVDIYTNIKEQKNIVINKLDYGNGGQSVPIELKNIMSLNVAAEMSVKLLEDVDEDHKNLLYFLGCLPGGITDSQLKDLWPAEAAQKSLDQLKKLYLLESSSEKLTVIPTMFSFIQSDIQFASKIEYIKNICQFYIKLLSESYKNIDQISSDNMLD